MQYKSKIINDPVHGFIRIPYGILYDIIQHPYFQRLRRISQTGLLSLIFPGATHTRFHHAIGAMHLMNQALDTLKLKGTYLFQNEEESAMLAILLHDVGHGPFSHALESLLMEDWHHEKLSLLMMNQLNEAFSGQLSTAIEMFQGKYHRQFFNQLISSQLDVDRMDYLKRDSFFTGVSEGNINASRIISMMNTSDDELVIERKGIHSIENYLMARMQMYWQVYYHKTAALAEFILVKILSRAKKLISEGTPLEAPENLKYFLYKNNFQTATQEDIVRFMELDDTDVLQAIKLWQKTDDLVLSYYCKAIIQRKLPKVITAAEAFSEKMIDEKITAVNRLFGIDYGAEFVHQISHKIIPYDTEKQPIYLLGNNGEKLRLEESTNQILAQSLKTPATKFILTFPKEIY
ncbi:MAG: HD domain-containing protein [Bergeyella zoohelcum]|nr:HD domain-containing protein [Bergeyella zoohelcum]